MRHRYEHYMALCQYGNHGNMAYWIMAIPKIFFRQIKSCDIKLKNSISIYHNMKNSKTNDLGIIVKLIQFSTYFFKLDSYCRKKLSKLANNKCGMLYVFSMQIAEIKFYMISAILGCSLIIYKNKKLIMNEKIKSQTL